MNKSEEIKVRIEPNIKNDFIEYCDSNKTTISKEIRKFILEKINK